MCTTLLPPVPPMFWVRPTLAPYLSRAGLAAELLRDLATWATPVAPTGWPLDFKPPAGVHRDLAAECGHAALGRLAALAPLHQTQSLEHDDLGDREAVVDLDRHADPGGPLPAIL